MNRKEVKKYMGKYIVIDLFGSNSTPAGKLIDLRNGCAILGPFSRGEWDADKGLVRSLIDDSMPVVIKSIMVITPSTEEDLQNYCRYTNKSSGISEGEEGQAGFHSRSK